MRQMWPPVKISLTPLCESDCFKKREKNVCEGEEHKYKGGKMNIYLSIITIKVNGFHAPIKRHRVGEWIKKQPAHMLPTKRPTSEQKAYTD